MTQLRWFDRKFDFSYQENIFPSIIERLEGTPLRLHHKINTISPEFIKVKPNGKWSIQEHIGHLLDLEPLWMGRLDDILEGKENLRPADLENKKTDAAHHNEKDTDALLQRFESARNEMVNRLQELSDEEIFMHALHPRLKTPMRTMDLFLFVAEHDDHHLAKITALNRLLSSV